MKKEKVYLYYSNAIKRSLNILIFCKVYIRFAPVIDNCKVLVKI